MRLEERGCIYGEAQACKKLRKKKLWRKQRTRFYVSATRINLTIEMIAPTNPSAVPVTMTVA